MSAASQAPKASTSAATAGATPGATQPTCRRPRRGHAGAGAGHVRRPRCWHAGPSCWPGGRHARPGGGVAGACCGHAGARGWGAGPGCRHARASSRHAGASFWHAWAGGGQVGCGAAHPGGLLADGWPGAAAVAAWQQLPRASGPACMLRSAAEACCGALVRSLHVQGLAQAVWDVRRSGSQLPSVMVLPVHVAILSRDMLPVPAYCIVALAYGIVWLSCVVLTGSTMSH